MLAVHGRAEAAAVVAEMLDPATKIEETASDEQMLAQRRTIQDNGLRAVLKLQKSAPASFVDPALLAALEALSKATDAAPQHRTMAGQLLREAQAPAGESK
jgi:hypothetical protein